LSYGQTSGRPFVPRVDSNFPGSYALLLVEEKIFGVLKLNVIEHSSNLEIKRAVWSNYVSSLTE